ncbi:ATP-binding cassette domain-containing protein, partial [Brevibacterium linens]|uniref:ATP-binding cassette domain-containing protein n=1 Tax=Brevibacterium linens TaxID=1703 RepID=UPI0011AEE3EF
LVQRDGVGFELIGVLLLWHGFYSHSPAHYGPDSACPPLRVHPRQLSGGQAQRVAIARARATQAQVVFADEPTGALDSRTAADVLALLLRSTSEQGRALVMVTHDKDVAAACSRVVRLRDGQIVKQIPDSQAD